MADELDFGGVGAGSGTGDGGKGSPWERIAAALAQAGIKIGSGKNVKDPEHLADLIEVAAMNSDPGLDDADDLGDLDEEPDPNAPAGDLDQPPAGATAAAPPPLQMSLRRQQEQAEGFARRNLLARIDELARTRRVTPAIADDLRGQVPALRLSFTAAGDPKPGTLTAQLDAYERLPEGAAWNPRTPAGRKAVRLSDRARAVPRPDYEAGAGADSPAQTEATLAAWAATGGK